MLCLEYRRLFSGHGAFPTKYLIEILPRQFALKPPLKIPTYLKQR